jgi:hypothetical protein
MNFCSSNYVCYGLRVNDVYRKCVEQANLKKKKELSGWQGQGREWWRKRE